MSSDTSTMRISYLDGLRGTAVLLVMAYHYFSVFVGKAGYVYPYGAVLAEVPLISQGYYGVHLFFAISGFVIVLTLERCNGLFEFGVRRFSRLWPTMLLCSVVTYVFLSIFPEHFPQRPSNFLPSLTFIEPQVWNRVIPGLGSNWVDGAYWSLFVEVRFYFIAALLYFTARGNMDLLFAALAVFVVVAFVLLQLQGDVYRSDLLHKAFIAEYLPWFGLGIGSRVLAEGRHVRALFLIALSLALVSLLVFVTRRPSDMIVALAVTSLITLPQFVKPLAAVLSIRWLAGIGISSYSLYLLHAYIGLTVISLWSSALGLEGLAALPVAIVTGLLMILISRLVLRYWEVPLNRALIRSYFLFRDPARPSVQEASA